MPVSRLVSALYALAVLDLLGGAALLGWPGAWHEWAHPRAMGTVFYPVQFHGALWFGRAALALWAARRPTPLSRAALAGAWAIEVPGAAVLWWRTGDLGPGAWVYAGLALFAAAVALGLWRSAHEHPTTERGEDGEHGSAA